MGLWKFIKLLINHRFVIINVRVLGRGSFRVEYNLRNNLFNCGLIEFAVLNLFKSRTRNLLGLNVSQPPKKKLSPRSNPPGSDYKVAICSVCSARYFGDFSPAIAGTRLIFGPRPSCRVLR